MENKADNPFKFSLSIVAIPLYVLLFMWFVYWFEITYGYNFNKYGIYPRTLIGLRGIIFSPFIHANFWHLFNNSIPLFMLMTAILYFYKEIAYKVIVFGTIGLGVLTWLIARPAYHIGSSGVVYLLMSFMLFSGLIKNNSRLIAVSFVIIFIYGGLFWYMLPIDKQISWEGHLSGFLIGLLLAILYRKKGLTKNKFHWEEKDYQQDEFDKLFDENGNFNPERANNSNESELDVMDSFLIFFLSYGFI